MTLQTGHKVITIHILPNISKSKSHQAMKFDQWIKMRNTFLEKSYIKFGAEVSPRPFCEKSKAIVWELCYRVFSFVKIKGYY